MLSYREILVIIFICCYLKNIVAQNHKDYDIPDSLENANYEKLKNAFNTNESLFPKAIIYANTYLQKAKKAKDSIHIAEAFNFLSEIHTEKSLRLKYADSIILFTKNKIHEKFPAQGYIIRGRVLYETGKFKESLDNYLAANKYAVENKNLIQQINIRHGLAWIKNAMGEEKEAHTLFKRNIELIQENEYDLDPKFQYRYLIMLLSLSDSYNRLHKLDSASVYIKKGIIKSLNSGKGKKLYPDFLLAYGINSHLSGEYTIALDSLNKVSNLLLKINDIPNIIVSQLYIGKTLIKLNKTEKAIVNLIKADSIIQTSQEVFLEHREIYEILIDYYNAKGNKELQLHYIEKLLSFDKIIHDNYQYLSKEINKKYDKPLLISEKEKIINDLRHKEQVSSNKISILVGVVLLSFLLLSFFYYRQHIYKKRFKELIGEKDKPYKSKIVIGKEKKRATSDIGISKRVIEEILEKLERFENKKWFLDNDTTAVNVAKMFKTNSTYLSKVVNAYKNSSFANYINDLRVDHAVEKLQSDKKFRLYSIRAIAEELGFKSTESFTKAFYKKTGIHVSFFIKQLKNKEL